jgi:hypothetical protein
MKSTSAIASLFIIFIGSTLGSESIPEYGTKAPSTFRVIVEGSGFRSPGIYHIEPNTNFGQIIKEANWLRICTGRFTITRKESGKTTKIEITKDKEDFKLHDGDIIEAETVISPQKTEQGAAANP